jgi:DNA/RNA-binding domain of Phe-tRNA-synthetase-like protein
MTTDPHPTTFRIDDSIFDLLPGLQVGVVTAFGIDNRGEAEEIIEELRVEEDRVARELAGTMAAEHPRIAPWREVYRAFGSNPKKYPSSIENLVGRALRGGRVRHINKLVDIYNMVSLRYITPAGGEDLGKVDGDILLTVAGENEKPVTLLGEEDARAPQAGEVIYKDDAGAICRRFNWKEAERTKLTKETTAAIFVIEAIPPVDATTLQRALDDLADMVEAYCGGSIERALLNVGSRAWPISDLDLKRKT